MIWSEVFRSFALCALPVLIITYLVIGRALLSKRLQAFSNNKELGSALKDMKRDYKNMPKDQKKGLPKNLSDGVMNKWLYFGGGFYGLMALITFVIIEIKEIIGFVVSLFDPDFSFFEDGLSLNSIINLFVNFLVNAIENLVSAFVWFDYWGQNIDIVNGWYWIAAAYMGYVLGAKLANRFPL